MATISGATSDDSDPDPSRVLTSNLRRPIRKVVRKVPARKIHPQKVPSSDDDDDFTSPPKKNNPAQPAPMKKNKRGAKRRAADVGDAGHDNMEEGIKPGNYATIRCSPGSVLEVIDGMPESLKTKIDGLGFGEFIKF